MAISPAWNIKSVMIIGSYGLFYPLVKTINAPNCDLARNTSGLSEGILFSITGTANGKEAET